MMLYLGKNINIQFLAIYTQLSVDFHTSLTNTLI